MYRKSSPLQCLSNLFQNVFTFGAFTTESGNTFHTLVGLILTGKVKLKVVLYSAVSSPLDRSTRFTLFASPGRPLHSDTNSAYPGSILARQKLRSKAKSLTFPPLSIARYSFIQLNEQGNAFLCSALNPPPDTT